MIVSMAARTPAIFLDRDGVIIENRTEYVRSWGDVSFIPNVLAALASIRDVPYPIVIITNQSVVGRGMISLALAEEINDSIRNQIEAAGGRIDGIYMCPHTPEDHCLCRKPQPGLLLQAALELEIDLGHSMMIGDALTDLRAGHAAGVRELILVRTGLGANQIHANDAPEPFVYSTYVDLSNALQHICRDY
jgi:D-glycero-D-manno-heptose 1,7-bisphosphate phosphatase